MDNMAMIIDGIKDDTFRESVINTRKMALKEHKAAIIAALPNVIALTYQQAEMSASSLDHAYRSIWYKIKMVKKSRGLNIAAAIELLTYWQDMRYSKDNLSGLIRDLDIAIARETYDAGRDWRATELRGMAIGEQIRGTLDVVNAEIEVSNIMRRFIGTLSPTVKTRVLEIARVGRKADSPELFAAYCKRADIKNFVSRLYRLATVTSDDGILIDIKRAGLTAPDFIYLIVKYA